MTERNGLPIAAYLGALVALALSAAFVAVLAVVIWLPPRPPDVMRADEVADHFQSGYEHMIEVNRPLNESGVIWSIRDEEPDKSDSPYMRATQRQLARELELQPDQVRVAASSVRSNETFVFRVREIDMDEITRRSQEAAERVARDAEREAERAAAEAEREFERAQEAEAAHAEARSEAQQARAEAAAERARERAEAAEDRARDAEERVREAQERMAEIHSQLAEHGIDHQVHIDSSGTRVEVHAPDGPHGSSTTIVGIAPPTPPEAPQAPEPPAPRGRASQVTPAPPSPPEAPIFAPAPVGVVLISGFEIGAQLPDGRWLVMKQGRNWAEIGWIARAALIIGGTLALLSVLAILFARRLTRPIRNFSDAVQAVGVDPQSAPVAEEGPQELRGAARAVNTMQTRLRSLIADRTKTLAAVAHDMRTPLMRLRLAAENVTPEQRERMAKEIGEVEALVASFIAFARDDPAEEARVRLDLAALLQSIADDQMEAGQSVIFEGDERLVVTGQPLGLKRLFSNLVENALKYAGAARVSMRREAGVLVVDVADDGPGIPADQRESVFEPFVRLSDGAGGAGLGLPAARSIARAHGGDIAILDAERGALLRVTLPG